MFLNRDEIKELTGKVRRPAQIRELQKMRIIHDVRPDGYPLILKAHIEKRFDSPIESSKKGGEPNWNAL
jgi:hypothetical protein